MALQLGPGGRAFLVALGMAVIAWGLVRAGLAPEGLDLDFATRGESAAPVPFVQPLPVAACDTPLRVAVPPRAAVLRLHAGLRAVPLQHGAAALAKLARGEVDAAVASVAEVADMAAAGRLPPGPSWSAMPQPLRSRARGCSGIASASTVSSTPISRLKRCTSSCARMRPASSSICADWPSTESSAICMRASL